MPTIAQHILDHIEPIVLVGGRSSRFGRDKLLEQVNQLPLVAFPIIALRAVFGHRVAVVGQCDQRVAALADTQINDPYPGLGPVGGICAALESTRSDVFVCAGDLISIDEHTIRTVIEASIMNPDAHACIAFDGRRHPTVAFYRAQSVSAFQNAVARNTLKLGMVLENELVHHVHVESSALRNINRSEDLDRQ